MEGIHVVDTAFHYSAFSINSFFMQAGKLGLDHFGWSKVSIPLRNETAERDIPVHEEMNGGKKRQGIVVDVIIPVHNAESTIKEAVCSAMDQCIPENLLMDNYEISVNVCCYDDGSQDGSSTILNSLSEKYSKDETATNTNENRIPSTLLIGTSSDGKGRGAGYARNRAIELSYESSRDGTRFLCLLDSDDIMHRHRIAEQTHYMMNSVSEDERSRTLLGSSFERDPPDSTWHYSKWANTLSQDRLMLERFREVTILQPTWFMCRSRWKLLGGYIEAPLSGTAADLLESEAQSQRHRLIHRKHDDLKSLRLAEDLRFFHEHLANHGNLRRVTTDTPLVTYRHDGKSQSYCTSLWGAGRDGKDFVKTLRPDLRERIYCFVDLDSKKLESAIYWNRELNLNIPVVHYSYLAKDASVRDRAQSEWKDGLGSNRFVGCIDKSNGSNSQKNLDSEASSRKLKRRRLLQIPTLESSGLSESILQELPVVVCVAMYRTNGVLEANVKSIGRTEGEDLWHFS
ncbi:unnamed protein product [Cylindrotheca closterium]|uniref:Glycosyltransferase 2-like domain-containing protein n=1 Tax=Cylindrotheca closterium TaxID=2856 RepID=A0AAD2CI15_9STRA|nr:unnamed protein product [Cylindrotheca closterium]